MYCSLFAFVFSTFVVLPRPKSLPTATSWSSDIRRYFSFASCISSLIISSLAESLLECSQSSFPLRIIGSSVFLMPTEDLSRMTGCRNPRMLVRFLGWSSDEPSEEKARFFDWSFARPAGVRVAPGRKIRQEGSESSSEDEDLAEFFARAEKGNFEALFTRFRVEKLPSSELRSLKNCLKYCERNWPYI